MIAQKLTFPKQPVQLIVTAPNTQRFRINFKEAAPAHAPAPAPAHCPICHGFHESFSFSPFLEQEN